LRYLRIAAASVVLVAILAMLGTPWVQVVEKNTRTDTYTYPTTYAYTQSHELTLTTVSTTGYVTILDLNNILLEGEVPLIGPPNPAYTSEPFQLGSNQAVKVEFHLRGPSSDCCYLFWFRAWYYKPGTTVSVFKDIESVLEITPTEDGFLIFDPVQDRQYSPEGFIVPLPDGCSPGQPCIGQHFTHPPDEPWWYYIDAYNTGNEPAYFDLKVTTPLTIMTAYATTSTYLEHRTSILTSVTTVTWYNTTYKRPLG